MMIQFVHKWDVAPKEAVALQKKIAGRVRTENDFTKINTVAGVDVGFWGGMARAAIVVLDAATLTVVDQSSVTAAVTFPYIPGLLTFREGPAVLAAFEQLTTKPDLLIFDGQGRSHPRRIGLASHMGVYIDIPSIGCAKSRLCGTYREPGQKRGAHTRLKDKREIIGSVVRTRTGVQPVYVSIGHRIDLETSIRWVLKCCRGYRLPETTRQAHRLASPNPRWDDKGFFPAPART